MSRVTLFVFSLSASRNWQNISLIEMAIRGCPHLKLFILYDELQAPGLMRVIMFSSPVRRYTVTSTRAEIWAFQELIKRSSLRVTRVKGHPRQSQVWSLAKEYPDHVDHVDHIMLTMATLSLTLPRTPYTLQDGLYSVHSTVLCTATSRVTCLILHLVNCKCDEYLDLSVHHTAPQTDQACVSPSYRPLLSVCRLGPPPDRTTQGFPNCWTVMSDNTHITHT